MGKVRNSLCRVDKLIKKLNTITNFYYSESGSVEDGALDCL
jgi:hypothetical protein